MYLHGLIYCTASVKHVPRFLPLTNFHLERVRERQRGSLIIIYSLDMDLSMKTTSENSGSPSLFWRRWRSNWSTGHYSAHPPGKLFEICISYNLFSRLGGGTTTVASKIKAPPPFLILNVYRIACVLIMTYLSNSIEQWSCSYATSQALTSIRSTSASADLQYADGIGAALSLVSAPLV